MQSEKPGCRIRQEALHLPLGIVLRRELEHALDGEAGAVARHAHLRRAVEHAVAREEPAGGARGARVGLHRVLRMRLPVAREPLGVEEMQLVVEHAALARGRVGEHPPAIRPAVKRRVHQAQPVDHHALALPHQRKIDTAVELDRAVLRALGQHVELPVVLEEERVREVMVGLEHALRLRRVAGGVELDHRDVRLALGVGQLLEEDVVAPAFLDDEGIGPVAVLRRHQPREAFEIRADGAAAQSVGEEPLLDMERAVHAAHRQAAHDAREGGDAGLHRRRPLRHLAAAREPALARAVQLAQRAVGELGGFAQELVAVARHGERISARPRLVGEARRPVRREAHLNAGSGERLGGGHFGEAGEGLALRAVGAEAEAPHAVARPAVERAVVDLAERECHV